MADKKCRVALTAPTKRRLWADSGGHCGNPTCAVYLFPADLDVDFGELAHIIPASTGGPRDVSVSKTSIPDRAHHGNIIILCANCHTVVDKAPEAYPAELLNAWKRDRIESLKNLAGAQTFSDRAAAHEYVHSLLESNKAVHERYGPIGDPYTEGNPALWRRHARSTIIPNNRAILRALDANRKLLSPAERKIVAVFRLHVEQFENRHLFADYTTGTERFPTAMNQILLDTEDPSGE